MGFGKNFRSMAISTAVAGVIVAAPFVRGAEPTPAQNPASSSSLRQLIFAIDGRRLPLHTLSAQMKVKLTCQNGKSNNLDALYIGDEHGNLRLRLTGPFGILALDLSIQNGRITCWMPLKKCAMSGIRTEILADGTSELAILAAIGNAGDMFFPRPWPEGATLRRANQYGEQLVVRAFAGGADTNCLANYLIDPARKAVISQKIFNRSGRALGVVEYLEFSTVAALLDPHAPPPQFDIAQLFPRRINVTDAGKRLKLELTVEKITLNSILPEKGFSLNLPANLEVGELLVAGKEFFRK